MKRLFTKGSLSFPKTVLIFFPFISKFFIDRITEQILHCIQLRNVELVADGDGEAALRELLPEDALYKPCSQLSGGMRRRVAVVRAMEADSDCVILDEPYAGLDEETQQQVASYIYSRQRGRILLIASHVAACEP